MKIICISDTHNKHRELSIPDGEIIIHAGDFTEAGTKAETTEFLAWFSKLPHPYKILIAGNHDFFLEKNLDNTANFIPANINYLMNSGISIHGLNFWGSPYTLGNGSWAFNEDSAHKMTKHWDKIPLQTQYLITHSPPYGILDELDNKQHIGCPKLAQHIDRLKLPHHIFGHNHGDYGIVRTKHTIFLNAASLDNKYRPINAPLVVHHLPS